MRYYNAYLPYILDEDYDRSFPLPEEELLWRIDDLYDLLDEYENRTIPIDGEKNIYDNHSATFLCSVSVIKRAIELAKHDLVYKYGLPEPEEIFNI